MTYSPVFGSALALLQLAVPSYALRLSRLFGPRRVGWPIFTSFVLLALLQLAHPWVAGGAGLDARLVLLYVLVPILLLIGLGHVEALSNERVRAEREEKRLRSELERQFEQRTAELAERTLELNGEIARRQQVETALKDSEAQYRLLFLENPIPMWIFDLRSLRFLAVNRTALEHYGYTEEEFMALRPVDLCQPSEHSNFARDVLKPCSSPQSRGLWRHCRKDRELMEVQVRAVDLMYCGYPARLVLAQDVTEQLQAQRRAQQPLKLEQLAALAGSTGEHFQKELRVLEGYTNLLLSKETAPAMADSLSRIASTIARATATTRQLLGVAGRYPLHCQPLDLNRMVDQHGRKLAGLLGPTFRVEKIFYPNLPPVLADAAVLSETLTELVNNARDAMPQGGAITLTTRLVQVDEGYRRFHEEARIGRFACLTVCDSGHGMTPYVRSHLFEPFFTSRDPASATGLNLAAMYGLVRQMGGWVAVKSDVGLGTMLSVYLPTICL